MSSAAVKVDRSRRRDERSFLTGDCYVPSWPGVSSRLKTQEARSKGHDGGDDGDATFALDAHPVGTGAAAGDLGGLVAGEVVGHDGLIGKRREGGDPPGAGFHTCWGEWENQRRGGPSLPDRQSRTANVANGVWLGDPPWPLRGGRLAKYAGPRQRWFNG